MVRLHKIAGGFFLLTLGYCLGSLNMHQPDSLKAQADEDDNKYGREVLTAYRNVSKAMRDLNSLLSAGGQNTTVSSGLNFFAVSVGGVNAEQDLEEGRGVDPETFAALYADLASPKIAEHLDYDELGRLRYKKNVIRLYSRDRLRALFHERDRLEVRAEAAE